MICKSCQWAGFENSIGKVNVAIELHDNCKNCECQHKVGDGWVIKKPLPPKR